MLQSSLGHELVAKLLHDNGVVWGTDGFDHGLLLTDSEKGALLVRKKPSGASWTQIASLEKDGDDVRRFMKDITQKTRHIFSHLATQKGTEVKAVLFLALGGAQQQHQDIHDDDYDENDRIHFFPLGPSYHIALWIRTGVGGYARVELEVYKHMDMPGNMRHAGRRNKCGHERLQVKVRPCHKAKDTTHFYPTNEDECASFTAPPARNVRPAPSSLLAL